ncbi:hypothetical protein Z042_05480 [Chania multitudinisentens RB-25]|uniref:Uncharacterized protein n=1 Tax=Chania multitudinisentens RB-25 TaxID=1441930 RepID=W0LJQ6_9GAMM|nr:tetratricopeptide repeat protein [Chania multitudinisentens]AHG22669.1 hypothetical protein Z042_05480 [Chania multitudinisentens RB-25]
MLSKHSRYLFSTITGIAGCVITTVFASNTLQSAPLSQEQDTLPASQETISTLRENCEFSVSAPMEAPIDACSELIKVSGQDYHLRAWATAYKGLAYDRMTTWGTAADKARYAPLALELYRSAIQINPKEIIAYRLLGDYFYNRDAKQAIENYKIAATLAPQDDDGSDNLKVAWLYDQEKNYREAVAVYTQLIDTGKGGPVYKGAQLYAMRAQSYSRLGELTSAVADYDEAIRLMPSNITYLTQRGNVYRKMKQYPKALADLDLALSRMDYAEAFLVRGLLKQETGDEAGAKEDIARAKDIEPGVKEDNL